MSIEQAREVSGIMEETPTEEQIKEGVRELRESAHVEDGIRISYVRKEGEELVNKKAA